MTPGIGVGKDIYEGLTGKNLLTGQKLSSFERALSFVSVGTPICSAYTENSGELVVTVMRVGG